MSSDGESKHETASKARVQMVEEQRSPGSAGADIFGAYEGRTQVT